MIDDGVDRSVTARGEAVVVGEANKAVANGET
jgi:hypothetical protein